MLVIQKRCGICQRVKKDKKLLQKIYDSKYFIPSSQVSLLQLADEEKLAYRALLVHVKKHQFIDSVDYTNKLMKHEDEKAERSAVAKAVRAVDAVQSIIDKGMHRLDEGEINVSTDQLIRASQVKLASDAKEKDQQLSYIAMVAHFAAGGANQERIYEDSLYDAEPDEPINTTS